jgi:flagellar export protein FliJ
MSARTSRLDTLLRVRRIEEETSRGRLATAAHAERTARGTLEEAHQRYAAAAESAVAAPLSDFLGVRRQHDALAGTVRVAAGAVVQAEGASDGARQAWTATAMRLAALERLDERGREADRQARLAADQRTAEESAASRPSRAATAQGSDS